jgi:hypothetical protein
MIFRCCLATAHRCRTASQLLPPPPPPPAAIFPQRHSRHATRSVVIKTHAMDICVQQLFMHEMIEKIFGRRTKLMFDPGLSPPRTNVIHVPLRLGMIQIP